MWVKPTKKIVLESIVYAIKEWLEISRFTADVQIEYHPRHKQAIKIECVRLRRKKPYCGQHPGPCLVQAVRKHRVGRWLEGADWVGFNDGLNDLFDRMKWRADIWSYNREAVGGIYYIRRGRLRRIDYTHNTDYRFGQFIAFWEKAEQHDFDDHFGRKRPLRSAYPCGTPGLADWRPAIEAKHPELFEVHTH